MKFRVSMKDPDPLGDAIVEAARESVAPMGLPEKERAALVDIRADEAREKCARWFEYGEYLEVDIDTEAGTCVVVEVGK